MTFPGPFIILFSHMQSALGQTEAFGNSPHDLAHNLGGKNE